MEALMMDLVWYVKKVDIFEVVWERLDGDERERVEESFFEPHKLVAWVLV